MVYVLFMMISIMGSTPERHDYTGPDKDFPSMEACETRKAAEEISVANQLAINNPMMTRGRHYEFVLQCEVAGKPA